MLLKQKIEEFAEQLKKYLLNSTSYHDLSEEKDYHNLMGGILAPLVRRYNITSNLESGYGRPDHILVPRANLLNNNAFIFEYKVCEQEEKLDDAAEIGLKQIDKQHYDAFIKRQNSSIKIIKVAFAFCRKKMVYKMKEEEYE